MGNDASPWDDLTAAILDGTPVDWSTAESRVDDEARRSLLRQLRLLSEIADLHRQPRFSTADRHLGAETARLGRWGHLDLLERIGQGAFGEVFRARDSRLDREVALKLVTYDNVSDGFGSSIVQEGRLLARVRHANVVTIYDADRIDDRVGLWMEFIRGRTLAQLVQDDGAFTPVDVIHVGIALCDALSAVHSAGLLHRDVKAQNVMRDEAGRLVLMDFGTGRDLRDGAGHVFDVAGTPLYLAPELFEGRPPSIQSDVYSVGVLLFHLATGAFPVTGATAQEVRDAHRRSDRRNVRAVRPEISEELAALIDRALAADPTARFETADALGVALRHLIDGAPGWSARKTLMLAGVAMVLGAAIAGGSALRLRSQRNPQDALALASLHTRQVAIPDDVMLGGVPSASGRYFPYADTRRGDLQLLNLRTGDKQPLTHLDRSWKESAYYSAVSADDRFVAYSWSVHRCKCMELRVTAVDHGSERVLRHDEADEEIEPSQWASDGQRILIHISRKDGSHQIALVSVADGSTVVWKALRTAPLKASLSHDGQYVAYDAPSVDDGRTRDIYLLQDGGKRETALVTDPADDAFPFWLPDDEGVVFASDRSGTIGLWQLPIISGLPQGEPFGLSKDMGRILPITLTDAGAFYYLFQSGLVDVYTAPLGRSNARLIQAPTHVARTFYGSNISADWAPDGKQVAFISIRRQFGPSARLLMIRSLETGADRQLETEVEPSLLPRWSPDGQSMFVRGKSDRGNGVFRLDVRSGRVLEVLPADRVGYLEWVDRERILFRRDDTIWVRSLRSGVEEQIYQAPDGGSLGRGGVGFSVSHDAQWIAFAVHGMDESSLHVAPIDHGGGDRVVLTVHDPETLDPGPWLNDDHEVLFVRHQRKNEFSFASHSELWTVPAAGGEPRSLGLTMAGLREVRINPAGDRIVFTSGAPTLPMWVMENFLQSTTGRR